MTKDFLFDKQIPDPFTRSAADTSNPEKNVTAIGWARARDGTGWQLVLAFADRDGRRHEVLAKRCDIARGEGLFELLDHHGYPVPANPLTRAELRRSITSAEPEPRFWMEGRGRLVPDHESAKVQVAVDR